MLSTRRRGGTSANGAGCAGVACEHTLGRQPLHLYGYLWAKPEFIIDDKCGTFSFVVPDTVVFKQQKPIKWFFTSKQDKGKILSKSKKNLSVTHVLQSFVEPKHGTKATADTSQPTIATANHVSSETETIVATYVYVERGHTGENVMVVEHLTPAGVHHLLTNRDKPTLSVLQRFVPTRSGYNHLIQSVFTPDNCAVRKCVNSHLMGDTRLCLPLRTATFEADEQHVKPRDVTKREQRDLIERMHLEMSNHLEKIIGKPVARHVAYFKLGADSRVYLLWSSMLSFETGSLAFAKNLRLSLSHNDRIKYLVATTSTSIPEPKHGTPATASGSSATKVCPSCNLTLPRSSVDFLVTFKAIIRAFRCAPVDPLVPQTCCIPPLLDKTLSPISEDRFKELCNNAPFMYRTVALCHGCARKINTTVKPDLADQIAHRSDDKTRKTERDLPIYMQSAHSIFWGKVEREQAAQSEVSRRSQSANVISVKRRPTTAVFMPNRRLHGDTVLSNASWKRILPKLVADSADAEKVGTSHCIQRLADHLKRSYGGPSVRLALSRANIYPTSSLVSLDTLQWICDRKLLADVFVYWTELCKAHGAEHSATTIDLDAIDGMLSVCTTTTADILSGISSKPRRPQSAPFGHQIPPEDLASPLIRMATLHPSTLLHPTRPSGRPMINHRSRPASARMPVSSMLTTEFRTPKQNNEARFAEPLAPKCSEAVLNAFTVRRIGGIDFRTKVSPIQDSTGGAYSLEIQVVNSSDPTRLTEVELESCLLSLTLNTQQILHLLPGSVPPSGDDLIAIVFEHLRIMDGSLTLMTPRAEGSGTDAPHDPSVEFSPAELALLNQTLQEPSAARC